MGVNIFNLIINIYLSTVIVAVIAFVLNFRRLDRYYRKQGLQAVFNKDSLVCLLMCFIPIVNLSLDYYTGMVHNLQMKSLKNVLRKKIRKNKKRRWHCEAYYKTKSFCRLLY